MDDHLAPALVPSPEHPVAAEVAAISARITALCETSMLSMPTACAGELLCELPRLRAKVTALEVAVLDHARAVEVGSSTGARSTHDWWAHHTRMTRAEAGRIERLRSRLTTDLHQPVMAALAAGDVLLDQAGVIVDAVDALPADLVDDDLRTKAQTHLLELAKEYDATTLRLIGKRILDVIAPEIGETHEAQVLEKEEAEARAGASLLLTDDGHGKCHLRGTIPSLHGAILRKHLDALITDKHRAATGQLPIGHQTPTKHHLGQAFCEYLETRPDNTIPSVGECPASIVVTMTIEALLDGLQPAQLDTGHRITASEARRLACRAGIIPIVLAGKSEVLDVGRKRRLHTFPNASGGHVDPGKTVREARAAKLWRRLVIKFESALRLRAGRPQTRLTASQTNPGFKPSPGAIQQP